MLKYFVKLSLVNLWNTSFKIKWTKKNLVLKAIRTQLERTQYFRALSSFIPNI
jgi:hypothetical protein